MIKNYNLYLITEAGITISNEEIVDILKSLEQQGSRNAALINKLVNRADRNGKTVLMNIVQENNDELIDYISKFDIDVNKKTKDDENVLFFCKNIKVFKKFYELGADAHVVNSNKENILLRLASKKIYNVELYEKLINEGIDINQKDFWSRTLISLSLLNLGILNLLLKFNVDLNASNSQYACLVTLFDTLSYGNIKKTPLILKIFKILFENGMVIQDGNISYFAGKMLDIYERRYKKIDLIEDFIKPFQKYIDEKILIAFIKNTSMLLHDQRIPLIKNILDIGVYPELFKEVKKMYSFPGDFNKYFGDWTKGKIYDDTDKYNL